MSHRRPGNDETSQVARPEGARSHRAPDPITEQAIGTTAVMHGFDPKPPAGLTAMEAGAYITAEYRARQRREAIEAVMAAGDQARISAYLPAVEVMVGEEQKRTHGGFTSFGNGVRRLAEGVGHWRQQLTEAAERVPKDTAEPLRTEMLIVQPVMMRNRVTKTREVAGRFGRSKPETYQELEPARPVMVTNPETGERESLMTLTYNFGGIRKATPGPHELPFRDTSGRTGSEFVTEIDIPLGVSTQFIERVSSDPGIARELGEALFRQNVPKETADKVWKAREEPLEYSARPPYEELPADWSMSVVSIRPSGNVSWVNIPVPPVAPVAQ